MSIGVWHAINGVEESRGRNNRLVSVGYGDYGTYKPSSATSGIPTGTTLTSYTGDIIITTAGTVLDSLDIFGFVTVRAANVTIRKCRIRGSSGGTNNTGLVLATHTAVANLVVEDCLLVPDYPSYWLDAVLGHDYTAQRCNTYYVVDGFGAYNTANPGGPVNVNLYGNYVHDMSYFSPDPNHTSDNQTHNDCFQPQGGANYIVKGNNFQGFYATASGIGTGNQPYTQSNSCVQFNNNVGAVTNMQMTYNWFDGGSISLNVDCPNTNVGSINYNRFGRNQRLQSSGGDSTYTISMPSTVTVETIGNVYDDTGTPILVRHNG